MRMTFGRFQLEKFSDSDCGTKHNEMQDAPWSKVGPQVLWCAILAHIPG